MRIIAGKYARRAIESPTGDNVRPPLTRCRKALFDTLMPYLRRGPYLDLFGGSGSFMIEALSRGAPEANAVELNARTARLIKKNAESVGVEEPFEVLQGNALHWIPKLYEQSKQFAVIAAAPPYYQSLENQILDQLDFHDLLQPDGILFVQHPAKEEIIIERETLEFWKMKKYGKTCFSYFLKK